MYRERAKRTFQLVHTSWHWAWLNIFPNEGQTLRQKAIRGGLWVFAARASSWGLWGVRLIVLTRLLTPKDFGLFGIAFLVMSSLETFSQTGFDLALIQKRENIEAYLDTAWTVQIIRGLILATILLMIAPRVAFFFEEPTATSLVQAIAFSIFVRGFTNIGLVYFQRELEFHKQMLFQLSGSILDLSVAVLAALIMQNAWPLILGLLAGHLIQMVVSYIIHPYRPRLRLNREKLGDLYQFGRWILGAVFLFALGNMGANAFIGKLLGVTTLGFYQMAYRISIFPVTEIIQIIQLVTFPVYVKVQDNVLKLRAGYLRVLWATALLACILAGGSIMLIPYFVPIFMGQNWIPIIPIAQLLTFWGLAALVAAPAVPILRAVGQPQVWTKLLLVWLIVMTGLLYPLTLTWGITGTLFSIVSASWLPTLLVTYKTAQIVSAKTWVVMPIPIISLLIVWSIWVIVN